MYGENKINMKKIILLLGVLTLVGCHKIERDESKKECTRVHRGMTEIYTVDIKGHEYIVYEGWKQGGMLHSESCPNSAHKIKQVKNDSTKIE